jgi:hypothetical protein
MNKETISLELKNRSGDVLTLHLGMISVAEDTEYQQRFVTIADLSPKEKADKEYQIYIEALAAWATEMPTKMNGTKKTEPLGKGTPAEAIKAYFSGRTNAKEWMAVSAINAFRNSLYPTVNFR